MFHDDHGHDTNRCGDPVELIAEAVYQGRLNHLLNDTQTNTTNAIILPNSLNASIAPTVNSIAQQERKAPLVMNLGIRFVEKMDNLQITQVINMVEMYEDNEQAIYAANVNWRNAPITFRPITTGGFSDEPIVISCRIANMGIIIKKVHVDTGSSVDVMYAHCFNKLPEELKESLKPTAVSLSGFSGESAWPIGRIALNMEFIDDENEALMRQTCLNLYVLRTNSRYNMLLGRTALRQMSAISSTIHGIVKFARCGGIATLTSVVAEELYALVTTNNNVGIEGHMLTNDDN